MGTQFVKDPTPDWVYILLFIAVIIYVVSTCKGPY